ncbi:hypothetical protein FLP41_16565 [Paracoccus marcusii]|uniref:hypothetical protein n=1 Tax=Paracoccus marcusii TaxID=59779 RepID=UPI002ED31608|nr:hypothetical protein FLP41_16565 [Paracoccus marcusii]
MRRISGQPGRTFSVDLGVGAALRPAYPGAEDAEVAPWIIWRDAGFGPVGTALRRDSRSRRPLAPWASVKAATTRP